jgi:hypothetical protein
MPLNLIPRSFITKSLLLFTRQVDGVQGIGQIKVELK